MISRVVPRKLKPGEEHKAAKKKKANPRKERKSLRVRNSGRGKKQACSFKYTGFHCSLSWRINVAGRLALVDPYVGQKTEKSGEVLTLEGEGITS